MPKPTTTNWLLILPRIVLPAALALLLFLGCIFVLILPRFEARMLADRRVMLRELTEVAWGILDALGREEAAGRLNRAQAQAEAIAAIDTLRYGPGGKDYFWLIDQHAKMLAHPYKRELVGQDLTTYVDRAGKHVFVDCLRLVNANGQGYLNYYWQWQDDPNRVLPKLSFVKGFQPWGWVVGTGLYIEDVHEEVAGLNRRLGWAAMLTAGLTAALLAYLTQQSVRIEAERASTEAKLRQAKEQYQTLVEASEDGLIMFLDGRYCYSNPAMHELLGYNATEFAALPMLGADSAAADAGAADAASNFFQTIRAGGQVPARYHVGMTRKSGSRIEVLLQTSPVQVDGKSGMLTVVKAVDQGQRLQNYQLAAKRDQVIADLQNAVEFFNQPVRLLSVPALCCQLEDSISQVAAQLRRHDATAVLVCAESGEPAGIVTASDLCQRALAVGLAANQPVCRVMSAPLLDVAATALLAEAAHLLAEHNISHLAVRTATGSVSGLIGRRQLLRLPGASSLAVLQQTRHANDVEAMAQARNRVPILAKNLLASGAGVRGITRTLSAIGDSAVYRLVELAVAELGPPPLPFAFLTFGSEGRSEQTLVTDQDNAIVYADADPDSLAQAASYFTALANQVCSGLTQAGYPKCPGNIMAMNEKWRLPLPQWQKRFASWINAATPADLLGINIFFDFRTAYGDLDLEQQLRRHIWAALRQRPQFFLHMALNCLQYAPPVGLFGNIRLKTIADHPKALDIKQAMTPLVNFARIYALRHELAETSTLDRIDALRQAGSLTPATCDDFAEVYGILMQMRLKHQVHSLESHGAADNLIEPDELSEIERGVLKQAFGHINTLQAKLSFDFKGML